MREKCEMLVCVCVRKRERCRIAKQAFEFKILQMVCVLKFSG